MSPSEERYLSPKNWKCWAIVCIFILFFALLLFFSRRESNLHKPSNLGDSSYYYSILLTSQGYRPYVDFEPRYSPGLFYLNALIFKAFGIRMSFVRLGVALFWMLDLVGLYLVARFLMPRRFAVLPPLLGLLWGPLDLMMPWASWYSIPPAIFSLYFTLAYIRERKAQSLFLAGVAAGISFFFKQSTGVYAMMFIAVAYALIYDPLKNGSAAEAREPSQPKSVLILRVIAVFFGCFVFPILLMRSNAGSREIVFHLAPLATLGTFLLVLIVRSHVKAEASHAGGEGLRAFLAPPALAGAGFFGVAILWFPIAAPGIGVVELVKYLFMLNRSLFVSIGVTHDFTPRASMSTFAPVLLLLSVSVAGVILMLRARPWLRLALAAGLISGEVAVLMAFPELREYFSRQMPQTSASMVLVLHFAALAYLAYKSFSKRLSQEEPADLFPLIAVLVFCNFFFLQLFPLNSMIHMQWAVNSWFVAAAWMAYALYKCIPEPVSGRAMSILRGSVGFALTAAPIFLYFAYGSLLALVPQVCDVGILLPKDKQVPREERSVFAKIKDLPQAKIIVRPKKLARPDLERVDVYLPVWYSQMLEDTVEYLTERTGPDEFIFGPNLNFINFVAARPSPLSENYFFPAWVTRKEEAEKLALLDLRQPTYVIFYTGLDSADILGYPRFRAYYPRIAAYLESNYDLEKTIGLFAIARRK